MVGVRSWSDDGVWFVLMASDIKTSNTSASKNGRPTRIYTDEQIAKFCRETVTDMRRIPDANGVKYIRSSKKSE